MKQTLLIITALMLFVRFSDAQTHKGMEFYESGEPKSINTYKESRGKLELVKFVSWHRNGQKKDEGTFKDGELNGKVTRWYENGQKEEESTWKDGGMIEYKKWDEDGNVKKHYKY